ncbi:MAG: hypothetical protein NC401_17050 [Ruminococcus sp.]|nr:hypothetical protein [Ruminococcus sp.]
MAKNARSENTWERQPGESAQAFEAFDLYCKMGEERSIRAVGQRLDKSRTQIGKWSSRWNWVSRARDYDNEIKRQEIQAEKKAFQTMRKRQIGMAVQFQKKAFEALQNLPIEALTPKDIKEFMKLGAEMERANMGVAALEQSREEIDETTVDIYLPEKDGDNR